MTIKEKNNSLNLPKDPIDAFLAGIGFTMAIFIGNLALSGALLDAAKVGIIIGSVCSAFVGILILLRKTRGGS